MPGPSVAAAANAGTAAAGVSNPQSECRRRRLESRPPLRHVPQMLLLAVHRQLSNSLSLRGAKVAKAFSARRRGRATIPGAFGSVAAREAFHSKAPLGRDSDAMLCGGTVASMQERRSRRTGSAAAGGRQADSEQAPGSWPAARIGRLPARPLYTTSWTGLQGFLPPWGPVRAFAYVWWQWEEKVGEATPIAPAAFFSGLAASRAGPL